MNTARRSSSGFSMVELAVAMAILAIMLAMGLPSLSTYLQNAKIANTAKSIFGGVQAARAEAIRRNLPVEFLLTSTAVSDDTAGTAAASSGGRSWLIRYKDPEADDAYKLVEAKSVTEGSGQTADASGGVRVTGSPALVRFDGVGGASSAVTINIYNPTGGDCAAQSGPMRCQRVVISAGGQVRLCDPAASAGDSRACPAVRVVD